MSEEKEMLFVSFEGNWADEMDIEGHRIFEKEEYDEYLEKVKAKIEEDGCFTFYVGTNEDIEYDNFEEFKSKFTTKEITEEEIKTLEKFGLYGSGFFPDFDIYD